MEQEALDTSEIYTGRLKDITASESVLSLVCFLVSIPIYFMALYISAVGGIPLTSTLLLASLLLPIFIPQVIILIRFFKRKKISTLVPLIALAYEVLIIILWQFFWFS